MSSTFGFKLSKLAKRLARLKGAVQASMFPPRPASGAISLAHNFSFHGAPVAARVESPCRVAMVAVGTVPITAACDGRPGLPAVRAARVHRRSRHALVTG